MRCGEAEEIQSEDSLEGAINFRGGRDQFVSSVLEWPTGNHRGCIWHIYHNIRKICAQPTIDGLMSTARRLSIRWMV
ncbi:Hypothetical protein NTJ_04096 [Nesidiocoris tenuis]|uniref:MULE transposase domain-containing protein n=1 Tax=Nesidiocoris tenuis TaxID=355587 RepID=A0ABN7AG92_9HEMI|nr:Hypothetical protein NTJ_04096 [Nesidiocoris tenuis]